MRTRARGCVRGVPVDRARRVRAEVAERVWPVGGFGNSLRTPQRATAGVRDSLLRRADPVRRSVVRSTAARVARVGQEALRPRCNRGACDRARDDDLSGRGLAALTACRVELAAVRRVGVNRTPAADRRVEVPTPARPVARARVAAWARALEAGAAAGARVAAAAEEQPGAGRRAVREAARVWDVGLRQADHLHNRTVRSARVPPNRRRRPLGKAFHRPRLIPYLAREGAPVSAPAAVPVPVPGPTPLCRAAGWAGRLRYSRLPLRPTSEQRLDRCSRRPCGWRCDCGPRQGGRCFQWTVAAGGGRAALPAE